MDRRFRTSAFGTGGGSTYFEAASIPDSEKETLCRSLLAEFGVTNIKVGSEGELIHSCPLPFGGHTNGDRNPSASLNYRKLTFNCLGCGNSGGLLWFIGVCRGTSGSDARTWLSKETGTGSEVQDLAALLRFFDEVYNPKTGVKAPIPRLSSKVLHPFLGVIHPYLTEFRHIPERTCIEFCVWWDQTSDRIVIPHFWNGHLVGWQSRRLTEDGSEKYKNTPDFPKESTVFNWSQRRRRAIVVESPMSVLSKHHITPDIEATFGAEVNEAQMRHIAVHPEVVLFFDNDKAGWKATRKVGTYLLDYSNVLVAKNPFAADPVDLDDTVYMEAVDEASPFALWSPPRELVEWCP